MQATDLQNKGFSSELSPQSSSPSQRYRRAKHLLLLGHFVFPFSQGRSAAIRKHTINGHTLYVDNSQNQEFSTLNSIKILTSELSIQLTTIDFISLGAISAVVFSITNQVLADASGILAFKLFLCAFWIIYQRNSPRDTWYCRSSYLIVKLCYKCHALLHIIPSIFWCGL